MGILMNTDDRVNATPDRPCLQVMVVEDCPGVRASIEAMVESWRAVEITAVGDFIAAISWIKTLERLDLLLCDVCLPGAMGGLEVAKAAMAFHPMVAVVMFSADLRSDIDGMSCCYSFLQKPFGRDALIMRIDDAFLRLNVPVPVVGSA